MADTLHGRPPVRWAGFEAYLLDQVEAAVIASDLDGVITHWNHYAETLYGWSSEEAVGRNVYELLVPGGAGTDARTIMDAVTAGQSWEGDFTVRRKDGSSVLVHVTDSPIRDPDGVIVGVVGVSVDITERVRHEQRLEARSRVTRILAEAESLEEASPRLLDALCRVLDWEIGALWLVERRTGDLRCIHIRHRETPADRRFADATRSAGLFVGEGLPGRVVEEGTPLWIPVLDVDDRSSRAAAAQEAGLHSGFAVPIRLGAETLGVLEFFSHEQRERDDHLLDTLSHIIGSQIGQFIERRAAERAVRESEAVKTAMLEAALDCIVGMDATGRIIDFNPAAERIFGYRRGDVLGRMVADTIVPPSLRDRHSEGLTRYLGSGDTSILGRRVELVGMRADGTEFPIEIAVTRADVPGNPLFTAFIRDLSREKEAARKLRERTASLQLALQAGRMGTWWWETGSGVVGWDETLESIFLLPPSGSGRTFEEYASRLHPEDRDWVIETVRRSVQTGTGHQIEHRILLPDGSVRWILAMGEVIRNDAGEVTGMTGVAADISDRKQAEEELAASREQLEAIFQGVAEGITVQGPDGGLIYANQGAARMIGYPSAEALLAAPIQEIMSRFQLMDEEGNPFPLDRLPGRRALAGDQPSPEVIRFRLRETGEERWSIVSARPVRDDSGRVRFAVNIFHDITEQKRAEDSQRLLAEVGATLSSSLEYGETLRRMARLIVPRLADWCSVSIVEEPGLTRQVAVEHVDPEKVRVAEELGHRYPPDPDSPVGVPQVLRTGRPELYGEITDAMLAGGARDDEHLRALRELQLRSAMIVPLVARGRTLGAITLVAAESGRRYGAADLAVAEELARQAAIHVDNSRLFTETRRVATALQQSLLPPALPRIPGIEVVGRYHAAGQGFDVGGDFYDVFSTGPRNWALVIGDVCGKGPEAAAVTGLARYTIRAAAMQTEKPSLVLSTLNEALLEQRSDRLFCTVSYVRLHLENGRCRATVCCGGHPLPFVVRADGTVEPAGRPGTLLGIFDDPELFDRTADLRPGDSLVLYTDGVVEAQRGSVPSGTDKLRTLLARMPARGATEIADAIEQAVLGERSEPPRDDIAMLVVRMQR